MKQTQHQNALTAEKALEFLLEAENRLMHFPSPSKANAQLAYNNVVSAIESIAMYIDSRPRPAFLSRARYLIKSAITYSEQSEASRELEGFNALVARDALVKAESTLNELLPAKPLLIKRRPAMYGSSAS